MNIPKFLFLFCIITASLKADSHYPVDVSFLIVDLKYNKDDGVKICEIQHGILSTFYGDAYLYGGNGKIATHFQEAFAEFPLMKWVMPQCIASKPIQGLLSESPDWICHDIFTNILKDRKFISAANHIPENPYDLSCYGGMLFTTRVKRVRDYEEFRKDYPGILVVDAAVFPYWIDKFKMNELCNRDPLLSSVKAEWNLYPKKGLDNLAEIIKRDLSCEYYVIKPRGAFLGQGVIIVSDEDLDATLKYIFSGDKSLSSNPDDSYNYWAKDYHDSFIVEKFYPSESIAVESFGGRLFDPTMRVAFILIYNNQKIELKILGDYWRLPIKSLDEKGTLNELHKCHLRPDLFAEVSDETREEVIRQLQETMPILYREMLEAR